MKKGVFFIAMYMVWLFLTWPFSPVNMQDIIAGLIVALIVTALLGTSAKEGGLKKIMQIERYFWGIVYIPVLIYYMIIANLDVLYRVFHPDMPISPGIVKINTELKSSIARAILCNSITLTPGTLTVDIVDNQIYVHWINVSEESDEEITERIAGRFEIILKKVFE
ncbi:Na+/H+ antiporter subunit E [Elusimicrobiota bacterium]